MRRRVCAVLVVMATLTSTSCAALQPSCPEFSREQTAADLPNAIVESGDDSVDLDTLRHVGDVDGYDVYLARGREAQNTICIVVMKDDAWESTGCGSDRITLTTRSGTEIEAGGLQPDDENALSESVRIVH